MNVSYTMFNNYHTAAKDFANGDIALYGRFMYIINMYAFEGEASLDDLTPSEKLFFTTVKASINKSIRLSKAGKKGGEKSKKTDLSVSENPADVFSVQNAEAYKGAYKGAYNEKEEEEEIEDEYRNKNKKKEEEIETGSDLFCSDFSETQNNILSFFEEHDMKIGLRNKGYVFLIDSFLQSNNLDLGFLDYVYNLVIGIYPKINAGIFFNAFNWQNTLSGYKAKRSIQEAVKDNMIPAPDKCSLCGSKLVLGSMPNTVECPECLSAGHRIWWEYNNHEWVCSE